MKDSSLSLRKVTSLIKTPSEAQSLLYDLEYSRKDSMKSAWMVWKTGTAHCLEAVHLVAHLLEGKGFPPLALSLDSADNICHVVYPFHSSKGWGSVGLSKEQGLHGRAPEFRSLKSLAMSYFDPYVDDTGRLTGYALLNLNESDCDWRYSRRNVWKSERHILSARHIPISVPEKRFQRALEKYQNGGHQPQSYWW